MFWRVQLTNTVGSSFLLLATVSRMLAGNTLIAPLVVAGDPGHELLGIAVSASRDLCQEVRRGMASKRGGDSAMMQDLDVPVLSASIAEAEITTLVV